MWVLVFLTLSTSPRLPPATPATIFGFSTKESCLEAKKVLQQEMPVKFAASCVITR